MGPTQLNLSTANSKQSIEELKVKIWKEEGRDEHLIVNCIHLFQTFWSSVYENHGFYGIGLGIQRDRITLHFLTLFSHTN